VRLVAGNFIEYGLNFRKFNQLYPDMYFFLYKAMLNFIATMSKLLITQLSIKSKNSSDMSVISKLKSLTETKKDPFELNLQR